ncbi:MAG: hypothetical protein IPG98_00015 [Burkholderiales bacterium]|nr:hypothetical protein [Burkholderiales bacterium]
MQTTMVEISARSPPKPTESQELIQTKYIRSPEEKGLGNLGLHILAAPAEIMVSPLVYLYKNQSLQ